ncbi:MAG: hypothetical protein Tsb005_15370 [Gammaproteobacteria bacterium]
MLGEILTTHSAIIISPIKFYAMHKSHHSPPGPSFFTLITQAPRDRLNLVRFLFKRYGDFVKLPTLKPTYLVSHPDYIETILKHPQIIRGGKPLACIAEALGHGLITNQGPTWQQCRHAVQPQFNRHHSKQFIPLINELTQQTLQNWERQYVHNNLPFDIAHEMMMLVLHITAQAFFDTHLTANQAEEIIQLIHLGNEYASQTLSLWPYYPSWKNLGYRIGKRRLHRLLTTIITEHYTRQENNLFTRLFELTDPYTQKPLTIAQLVDEFKTLLITGHETTGTALAWTWYFLAKHPSIMTQLQDELQQQLQGRPACYEDLAHLPFLRAVFDEVMRMYPPIWLTGRTTLVPTQLGNYTIPTGASLLVCSYTLHHHPAYWPQPDEFCPQRFTKDQTRQRPGNCYIPFGLGPRVCIAGPFAVMQAQTIIANIAQRYHFELVTPERVEVYPLITLRSRHGIRVKAKKGAVNQCPNN